MNNLIKIVKIENLHPASYNPRKLEGDAQEDLKNSITDLGIIKAIVIRGDNGTILAGHQRTKTMKILGITECPAFIMPEVSEYDEVRFNQLHNFTEAEVVENAPVLKINVEEGTIGFITVKHKDIQMINPGGEGGKVKVLGKLIAKYGQFANAVCDYKGNIIISNVYAKAIKLLRKDLLVYVLPKGLEEKALYYFSKQYGQFNYDHIKRQTYIQHNAQPTRPIEYSEKGLYGSILYDKVVLPRIDKSMRILDFGAGFKEYQKKLKGEGYNIDAIEFFYVGRGMAKKILTEIVEQDCAEICRHIEKYGLYDVVVCDSVINSVDSVEAEKNVLLTLSAFCKKDGIIFWSGRGLLDVQRMSTIEKTQAVEDRVFFLDENSFTANYKNGVWFFQHYHNMEMIRKIQESYIGNEYEVWDAGRSVDKNNGEIKTGSFQVAAVNKKISSCEDMINAIKFEFTLPLPGNRRYELDKVIMPVMEKILL